MKKTNAMRLLDSLKLDYQAMEYDNKDGRIDGLSVAEKIKRPVEDVYKTLVTQSREDLFVFIVPVAEELDFKKAARAVSQKKLEMLEVKKLEHYTGYVRGGCSPLAMKKSYRTVMDNSALERDRVIVSGGKIGVQIELDPRDLKSAIDLDFEDIVK